MSAVFRRSLRVLVVDDFRPLADHLAEMLRRVGHTVRVAYDGAAALLVAEEFQPHALISDIHMPGMSGFELAQAIAERLPNCTEVLVTIDPHLVTESCDRPKYRVLQKPVQVEELSEFLAACEAGD